METKRVINQREPIKQSKNLSSNSLGLLSFLITGLCAFLGFGFFAAMVATLLPEGVLQSLFAWLAWPTLSLLGLLPSLQGSGMWDLVNVYMWLVGPLVMLTTALCYLVLGLILLPIKRVNVFTLKFGLLGIIVYPLVAVWVMFFISPAWNVLLDVWAPLIN
jgi:hypothetical protein